MTDSIAHETKKTAPSSYVAHYHMTREPFGEAIEDDLFYAEPGRQQKLDILLHLTQYGNELVIVTGPAGSGKTTVLQQYLAKALDNWSVAHVDAQSGIDERKLLQQLFHQMGMEFHGATHSELFERMQHHFDTLQHSARQAVMLIDNAEQLPVTALKRILQMAELTSTDNKPLLRVILFGTNRLNENFDDPLLVQYDHIIRRRVELLPFEQEHTAHYILHRLSAANFSANKPFTDAVLYKIHKQSGGWPGRINLLAHNILIETLPTSGINQGNASTFNVRHLGTALAGIVLVGTLLFFQDELSDLLNQQPANTASLPTATPLQTEEKADTATAPGALTADETSSSEKSMVETSPVVLNTNTASEESGTFVDEAIAEPETQPDTGTEELSSAIEPAPVVAASDDTQAKPVSPDMTELAQQPGHETEPESKQAAIATEPTPKAVLIPDDLPGFRAPWIRKQNPAHYTLQLVAGNNLKTLRSFISQYTLEGPLAVYHTTRKGRPWFGLIQQSYPSKQAAIDARSKLPAPLRKQKPWVRTFASLQKDLDQAP